MQLSNIIASAARVARRSIFASLTISVTIVAVAAQTPQFTPGEEKVEDWPAGPGRDEAFYSCTPCHNFKLVAAQGMNRRQWEDSMNLMVTRHNMPPLEGDDRKLVLDYLEATYPPRAPATGGGWQNPFLKR